ncbi:MAG: SusC/RagA family TonB-linked outer membrane protein [Mangrovibacterium sp.]
MKNYFVKRINGTSTLRMGRAKMGILLLLVAFFSVTTAMAVDESTFGSALQEQAGKRTISGKVVDDKGNPLPGVTVVIQGTQTGTLTDGDGKYSIQVGEKDALNFSFIGFKTQLLLVEGQSKLDVSLKSEIENIEEVSVVAFGQQKKESIVSAITTVKPEALKSSNSDLTSSFAGNIAGLIGWDTGGAPGALTEGEMNTKFYIRGITSFQSDANIDPLILLDGIEVSKLDLARIDPDDIESFNVMKDASATAMYGARGANGVIYVTTKKGEAGNMRATVQYERIWSMPTREIDVVGPQEYMRLYNQASLGRGMTQTPVYSEEKIRNTGSSRYPSWVYPANDWYSQLFKDYSVNNHFGLNVRGGGEKIQYYVSLNHNRDNGMLETDPINQFDANILNQQTNFRTNINVDLTKTAKLVMNTFSTYDNYHGTIASVSQAYAMAFNASPVDFAMTYPVEGTDYDWPHIAFGGARSSTNPYAEIQKGYQDRIRFSTINNFEYIQNLSSLVKGLEFRGTIGLTKTGYFANAYAYTPWQYTLASYDFVTGEHELTPLNESGGSSELKKSSDINTKNSSTTMDYQARVLHSAAWDAHQTSFTGVFTARQSDNSTADDILTSLPSRNISFAFRGTYGYKDRYFAEMSVGINGSERFAPGNRIGYFPAGGIAWVATQEDFLRSASKWLSYLKLRGSYGITGNDGVINDPRFVYLESIGSTTGFVMGPTSTSSAKNIYNMLSYGNEETQWEIAEQSNLGIDFRLFGGLIDVTSDIYQEIRHNIYTYRNNLPLSLGLYQSPLDNIGKVRSRGVDIAAKVQHAFSSDFYFLLNGTFTYNKSTYLEVEEALGKPDWQKRKGHDISQQFAYIADGLFQDQAEIDNSPFQAGDIQPGDIKYRDVDGSGTIDVNDAVLAGYPETPRIIYGLSAFVGYKSWEFSMAFQGSGNRTFFLNPEQLSPFYNNRAVLREIADSHWTAENQASRPFWPKLSPNNIIDHNPQEEYDNEENVETRKSTYFMRSGKFIRCTNIEAAYYINKRHLERFNINNFKIYVRANNPFLISNFDIWDIELGESGFNYPIQKTYSIGVNFSF